MNVELSIFIVCYEVEDEVLKFVNNISEEGLIEEVRPFMRVSEMKIHAIEMVNMNENKKANLQIILKNGDRLFFYVSKKGFQLKEHIDSPQKKLKKSQQPLVSYDVEIDKYLSIYSNSESKCSFLAQKIGHCNDSFEREHISEVNIKMIKEKTI